MRLRRTDGHKNKVWICLRVLERKHSWQFNGLIDPDIFGFWNCDIHELFGLCLDTLHATTSNPPAPRPVPPNPSPSTLTGYNKSTNSNPRPPISQLTSVSEPTPSKKPSLYSFPLLETPLPTLPFTQANPSQPMTQATHHSRPDHPENRHPNSAEHGAGFGNQYPLISHSASSRTQQTSDQRLRNQYQASTSDSLLSPTVALLESSWSVSSPVF